MNNEHVKGAAEKGEGKIKEVAGRVTGNKELETKGRVDQVKGAAHSAAGDAKDAVKDTVRRH